MSQAPSLTGPHAPIWSEASEGSTRFPSPRMLWCGPLAGWLFGQCCWGLVATAGASREFVLAISFTGVLVLMANLAGQLPLLFVRPDRPDRLTAAVMVSVGLRSMLALLACVGLLKSAWLPAVWVGFAFIGWYAWMLAIDLIVTGRYLSRLDAAGPASERDVATECLSTSHPRAPRGLS